VINETEIVSYIVFGFSLSMVFYFFGQISRILIEVVETLIKR
jgi:hypothetical protein